MHWDWHAFTTLDYSRGVFQIAVAMAGTPETAFICQRIYLNLIDFQRLINTVLWDTKFNSAMAYMGDVVVLSKTLHDHINHL
ncbi:hypothetical protein ANAPC5_01284 [Anaplasma phagocytophilum]|nr:hypothetical protein ANAPC5_01284 [Anaplasma phagocytophilum]